MDEKNATTPEPATDAPSEWARMAWTHLDAMQRRAPLVPCITNLVSMDIAANVLLASGASSAMIHSIHEIPDFTPKVDALYINIGTLSAEWVSAMETGAKTVVEANRPWVLDHEHCPLVSTKGHPFERFIFNLERSKLSSKWMDLCLEKA